MERDVLHFQHRMQLIWHSAGEKFRCSEFTCSGNCRCGRLWRHHAHRKAVRRSTGTASATDLPHPATTTASSNQPQSASSVSTLPLLESGALISALLLNPTHDSVRSLAVSLLKQLCLGTPHMTIRLVSRLAALLPQASAAGECHYHSHHIITLLRHYHMR